MAYKPPRTISCSLAFGTQCRLVPFLNRRHPSAQQTVHQLVRVLFRPHGTLESYRGLPVTTVASCLASFTAVTTTGNVGSHFYHNHHPLQTTRFQALDGDLDWSFRGSLLCHRGCLASDSSRSVSTTSMSSASPRSVLSTQTRGAMISPFSGFL